MRPWSVLAILAAILVAAAIPNARGLERPDAVLASAQALPAAPASLPPSQGWTEGQLTCAGLCHATVPPLIVDEAVELWLTWDGTQTVGFVASIDGAPGVPAFDAVRLGVVHGGEAVLLWGNGTATFVLVPHVPGVPELAALVPANLGGPLGPSRGHGEPSRTAPDCLEDEVADLRVRDCLRFTTGVANVGDTALALDSQVRDGEARMTQRLPAADRAVGLATYHDTHAHFHYARFVAFDLHARTADGLRGPAAVSSSKTGFCMVDYGRVEDAPVAGDKVYWRDGCAPGQDRLAMGINPGWYDIYRWFLPEQLIDPTGLPAGTYELVATVDPDGTLVEGNPLDNRASLVFRWDGEHATALAGHGLYALSPQPS